MRLYAHQPKNRNKKENVVVDKGVGGKGFLWDQMNSKPGTIVIKTVK
jgi:hypothetical protein